jgi:hypothetical protein
MSMTFTVQVEPIRGRLSGMSNAVSIQPVDIPGPVQNITGVFDQFKIRLDWQPPARNGNLAELYIVKRSDKPERTVKEPNLEDQEYEPGKVYTYTITPARGPGPVIPGPSSEFKLSAVDTKKPAVPAELTIDPNEAGAFLSWRENTERDVAGYYIYRSDRPDTGFARVNVMPHSSHIFAYPAYRPGDYFSVSAVDSSGNESDKSPATRGP